MLSRHAEAIYWLARYMVRVEDTARICDLTYRMLLETSQVGAPVFTWAMPLEVTSGLDQFLEDPERHLDNEEQVLDFLCFDRTNPSSLLATVEMARQNALSIRDQIPSEMVEELNKLHRWMADVRRTGLVHDQPHAFFQKAKNRCHLFEGIAANAMLRGEGWQFHLVGRWLERGVMTARLLEVQYELLMQTDPEQPELDQHLWVSVLKSLAAYEAYRGQNAAQIEPSGVLELLVLDTEFPRSLVVSARNVVQAALALANATGTAGRCEASRLARRLAAQLSTTLIDEVLATGPARFLADCQGQFGQIHAALRTTYFTY